MALASPSGHSLLLAAKASAYDDIDSANVCSVSGDRLYRWGKYDPHLLT